METNSFIRLLTSLSPTVLLPFMVFLVALVVRVKVRKAAMCSLSIAIGFTGIFLAINLLLDQVGPAGEAMVTRMGLSQNVIDVGWPVMASAAWAWRGTVILVPVGLVINLLMLWARLTRTVNVDLWTYWQFAFIGAMVYAGTGSLLLGVVASLCALVIALIFADMTAPMIQKYFALEGVSFPHLTALGSLPLAYILGWLYDKLPVLKNLKIETDSLAGRFGVWGEPPVLGFLIGCLLGLFAGYPAGKVIEVGVALAATVVIMPKMVGIFVDGFTPVAAACREFISLRSPGKELYIGINTAVTLSNPTVIVLGLLLIPIAILLAFILPGNTILPMADLTVFPFLFCLVVAFCRGDLVKSTIIATVCTAGILYASSNLSPLMTEVVAGAGMTVPASAAGVANIDRGNLLTWAMIRFFTLFR